MPIQPSKTGTVPTVYFFTKDLAQDWEVAHVAAGIMAAPSSLMRLGSWGGFQALSFFLWQSK